MTFIGIDYSITSPAICVYEGEAAGFAFGSCQLYSLTSHQNVFSTKKTKNCHFSFHKEFKDQIDRFDHISDWAMKVVDDHDANDLFVGIEGYAMGAKGQVFNIAENTGILKYKLFERGIHFEAVAPTSVKKFATGKGAGKKDKMFEQFVADTGIDLKAELQPNRQLGSPTTDLIDAFYICKYFVVGQGKN